MSAVNSLDDRRGGGRISAREGEVMEEVAISLRPVTVARHKRQQGNRCEIRSGQILSCSKIAIQVQSKSSKSNPTLPKECRRKADQHNVIIETEEPTGRGDRDQARDTAPISTRQRPRAPEQ